MSKIVTVGHQPKKPVIIVQDIVLKSNYYKATHIYLKEDRYSRNRKDNTNDFVIYWNDRMDFIRGISQLKRRDDFVGFNYPFGPGL